MKIFTTEFKPFEITVQVEFDKEAKVYVASSADVPGLATEAPTLELLREKLQTLIPDLLAANRSITTLHV
jgi:hypothetical protein